MINSLPTYPLQADALQNQPTNHALKPNAWLDTQEKVNTKNLNDSKTLVEPSPQQLDVPKNIGDINDNLAQKHDSILSPTLQTQQSKTETSERHDEIPEGSPPKSDISSGRVFKWNFVKKEDKRRDSVPYLRKGSSKSNVAPSQGTMRYSIDSNMGNSYLLKLQELYQKTSGQDNQGSKNSESPIIIRHLTKENIKVTRRQGSMLKAKIRKSIYKIAQKKLNRRHSKTINDPEEFSDLIHQVKSSIRIPKDQKLLDIEITKKTQWEQIEDYNDNYPALELRKKLMKIQAIISLIAAKIIKHPLFDYFILLVILANSAILAVDDPTTDVSSLPAYVDTIFLAIYTFEMCIKIIGMGFLFCPKAYLRDPWNIMDFIIVIAAYIPFLLSSSSVNLQAFRSLRVLRPLRTISSVESLRILIKTLLAALQPLLDTLLILFFLFMIFAIGGLQLFSGLMKKRCFGVDTGIPFYDLGESSNNYQKYCNTDDDCGVINDTQYICGKMIANPFYNVTNFDTILSSFLMVFQIVTLEGWSDIMIILQKTFSSFAAFYFVFLIFVGAFFLLNLTLAVIKAEFTVHSHHLDRKSESKDNNQEVWDNKEVAEKIIQHKLDLLSIKRKQTNSTVGYHKYQFKKGQLIAVQSSKFTKKDEPKAIRVQPVLKRSESEGADAFANLVMRLIRNPQLLRGKKFQKVRPAPQKNVSKGKHHTHEREENLNSTSSFLRKNESDSTLAKSPELRTDQSKSPLPTNEGEISFQGTNFNDQSKTRIFAAGLFENNLSKTQDSSMASYKPLISLKAAQGGIEPDSDEVRNKTNESIKRNNRPKMKLNFEKVGDLNKIVEVNSPQHEEIESQRSKKEEESTENSRGKQRLMPIKIHPLYLNKKGKESPSDAIEAVSLTSAFTPTPSFRSRNGTPNHLISFEEFDEPLFNRGESPNVRQDEIKMRLPTLQEAADFEESMKESKHNTKKEYIQSSPRWGFSMFGIAKTTKDKDKSQPEQHQLEDNSKSAENLQTVKDTSISVDKSSTKLLQNKPPAHNNNNNKKPVDSKLSLMQRLNQIKGFRKSKEYRPDLNTSGRSKNPEKSIDLSLIMTEDLEEGRPRSMIKATFEDEANDPQENGENDNNNRLKRLRTFKPIALRSKNLKNEQKDEEKPPEKPSNNESPKNDFKEFLEKGDINNNDGDNFIVITEPDEEINENVKEKKLIIDFRKLKVVPVKKRKYDSSSLDDVLPMKKELERKKMLELEEKMLREARLPIELNLTPLDKQRAKEREELTYILEDTNVNYFEYAKEYLSLKKQNLETLPYIELAKTQISRSKIVPSMTPSAQNLEEEQFSPLKKAKTTQLIHKDIKRVFRNLAMFRSEKGLRLAQKLKQKKIMKDQQEDQEDFTSIAGSLMASRVASATEKFSSRTKGEKGEVISRTTMVFEKRVDIKNYKEVKTKIMQEIGLEANPEEFKAAEEEKLKSFDFEEEFKKIRHKDLELQKIRAKNWSGDNVLAISAEVFPTDSVKKAITFQDFDIWRPGVLGVVHALRRKSKRITESNLFNNIIILSVLMNTVILASDGLIYDQTTLDAFSSLNTTFTIIFAAEMFLKIFAFGPIAYARDKINLLDAFIVILSLVEAIFFSGGTSAISAFRTIRLFRTFRVLRVTKLLRSLSYMQVIIGVIVRSIKKFIYIAILLFLLIFIFALLGMQIFGGQFSFPDNVGPGRIRQNFDTFINAFITVFQCMSQENWQQILFMAMRSSVSKVISTIYLVLWIFIGNYIFLNLFLAILLDEFMSDDVQEDLKEVPLSVHEENEDDVKTEKEVTAPATPSAFSQSAVTPRSALRKNKKGFEVSPWDLEDEDERTFRPSMFDGVKCEKSLGFLSKSNWFRKFCWKVVKHRYFETAVMSAIALSSIKLALDTYITDDNADLKKITETIDTVFNTFFAVEAFVKIISYGFCVDKGSYLQETWNILDFIIVLASLMDTMFEDLDFSFIKILRLLRTLRPLRFISHNANMRLIVTALLESVGAIFNVLIVVMLIWLMFAILAVNIIGDKLGFCDKLPDGMSYYGIGINQCPSKGGVWTVPNVNFDNVFSGMLSLFIVSTQEGWPDIMFTAVDANDANEGPIEGGSSDFAYAYFVVFLFIGSYFLMNLFIGVIFLNFTRAQRNENHLQKFLTPQQQKWVIMQKLILNSKPDLSNVEPNKLWQKRFFRFINHSYFDIFIITAILLNIITMALSYDDSSQSYNDTLKYINWAFSSIFLLEMILKHIGLGFKRYWMSGWNQFDAFVVIASLVDIVFDMLEQSFLSFIRFGPQLARVFRVLRVSRLLKLVKKFDGLQKIINTLIFSLPSLLNVGALLSLVFFIYAILATFLFKNITQGEIINDYVNFKNFSMAILTLFRASTGEDWFVIMFDTMKPQGCSDGTTDCGSTVAVIFWLSFIVICQFIFLNLFILVILQQFEEYHLSPDNPVNRFRTDLDVFRTTWEKYSLKHGGRKIPAKQLLNFFTNLEAPLGFKSTSLKKAAIAKQVMLMNVLADWQGMIFYNDVLFAAMKNAHGSEEVLGEINTYVLKEEMKTKQKLEETKRKFHFRGSIAVGLPRTARPVQPKAENPIFAMLMIGMTLKAWANYSHKVSEKRRAAEENDLEYVSSENEQEDAEDESFDSSDSSRSENSNSNRQSSQDGELHEGLIMEESEENELSRQDSRNELPPSYSYNSLEVSKENQKEENEKRQALGLESETNRDEVISTNKFETENNKLSLRDQKVETNLSIPSGRLENEPLTNSQTHAKDADAEAEQEIKMTKTLLFKKPRERSRTFSKEDGEHNSSVINYNISNNVIINNNFYIQSNTEDIQGLRPPSVVRQTSVTLQRDVSINVGNEVINIPGAQNLVINPIMMRSDLLESERQRIISRSSSNTVDRTTFSNKRTSNI